MSLEADSEGFDILLIELEPFDLDDVAQVQSAYPAAKIVAISGEYREADCIEALEKGADYLARPFRKHDLLARVRAAQLRLFKATGRSRCYRNGPLVIDLLDRRVVSGGQSVDLSPSQMKMLMLLASRPGEPVPYDQILTGLGAPESSSGRRALRLLVLQLRRRIERDPRRPEVLLTEAGFGYRLATPPASQSRHSPDHSDSHGIRV